MIIILYNIQLLYINKMEKVGQVDTALYSKHRVDHYNIFV